MPDTEYIPSNCRGCWIALRDITPEPGTGRTWVLDRSGRDAVVYCWSCFEKVKMDILINMGR